MRPLDNLDNFHEGYIDNENHLLLQCSALTLKRNCFMAKYKSISPSFNNLSEEHKLFSILCPRDILSAKLVNKYIKILFRFRSNIDDGVPAQYHSYESGIVLNELF